MFGLVVFIETSTFKKQLPRHLDDDSYLLTVYAKGVKDDLTAAEREAWRKAVEAIEND